VVEKGLQTKILKRFEMLKHKEAHYKSLSIEQKDYKNRVRRTTLSIRPAKEPPLRGGVKPSHPVS